jgi:diaminohydroxyphosphoribosylaminopyrimidine deaminase/5-amino-6-(5-phosphoribosylamino)uracil reductase
MDSTQDTLFMRRALELATLGRGSVSPNPMVGCVIAHKGRIIGEGWHRKYGGPHAEVNAVADVADKALLAESTAYVTLEPCSHFGKTPPCADLLIQHRLKRVVVCNVDTNPLVGGQGIAKLRGAGIGVETGLLEAEGRMLNRRFFTFMEKRRPYILLKWAETADGFIARPDYSSKWISNAEARRLVHKWRSEEDAVLVGTNTALYDNPRLNVRDWTGEDPIRIVVDRFLRLPAGLHLFDQTQTTLCYNLLEDKANEYVQYIKLDDPEGFPAAMLEDLYRRKVGSVLVEGGAALLNLFIGASLWDEARVFRSPVVFGNGVAGPALRGAVTAQKDEIGDNSLYVYYPASF